MSFELALKRIVCLLQELLLVKAVPYNWAGHREGSVAKAQINTAYFQL